MLSKPNILVCTDLSQGSDAALRTAAKLREKTSGHLEVLHVSEYPISWDWLQSEESEVQRLENSIYTRRLADLNRNLNKQLEEVKIKCESSVLTGLPSSVIMQQISDKKIDLVVMGHKNKQGILSGGSLAERIVAYSPVPVLIIKSSEEITKIAALVDPAGPMKEILSWGNEFSFLFSSKLLAVSLFPDIQARYFQLTKLESLSRLSPFTHEQKELITNEITDKVKSELVFNPEAHVRVEMSSERKVAFHLCSILNEEKVDLAIMKRHQSNILEKILIGSETHRMLEIFNKNLLILPA